MFVSTRHRHSRGSLNKNLKLQGYVTHLRDSASSEDICSNLPQFQGLLAVSPSRSRPAAPRTAPAGDGRGRGWRGRGWRRWGGRRSRRSREAPRVSLPTRSRARPLGLGTCSGFRERLCLSAFQERSGWRSRFQPGPNYCCAALLLRDTFRKGEPGISPLTGLIFLTIIISPLSVFFTENFHCEPRQRAQIYSKQAARAVSWPGAERGGQDPPWAL